MLFTPHTSASQWPSLGAPVLVGPSDCADWPQEPIAVVDGVPFLITLDYNLAGLPESSEAYLKRCVAHCDWNSVRYRQLTSEQMHAALAKLVASAKWKRPLKLAEIKILSAQIEAAPRPSLTTHSSEPPLCSGR